MTNSPGHEGHDATATPVEFWENRYAATDQVWSGRVNAVLETVAADLPAGRALDLGCGEGADVLWLAGRDWTAIGIDISSTAVERARAAARSHGLPADVVRFVAAELSAATLATLDLGGPFDLVTASFFQSPVALERVEILRAATELVAPGGHLLVTAHAAPPPWAHAWRHDAVGGHRFLDPQEEVEDLSLDPAGWDVALAQVRQRQALSPDGEPALLDDSVVLVRRR